MLRPAFSGAEHATAQTVALRRGAQCGREVRLRLDHDAVPAELLEMKRLRPPLRIVRPDLDEEAGARMAEEFLLQLILARRRERWRSCVRRRGSVFSPRGTRTRHERARAVARHEPDQDDLAAPGFDHLAPDHLVRADSPRP